MTVIVGDALTELRLLPAESVQCCITSPPYYGLRDYGTGTWEGGDPECAHRVGGQVPDRKAPRAISAGVRPGVDASVCRNCGAERIDRQIGLESTLDGFVATMVEVFREVRRVLRDDGTLWLNLGDSYNNRTKVRPSSHQPALNGFVDDAWRDRAADGGVRLSQLTDGMKEKDLFGVPWTVALALRADGWWLRSDIIWHKPNPMPESIRDRPTSAHEHIFLLSKSARYFYDADAIREPHKTGDLVNYDPALHKTDKRNQRGILDGRTSSFTPCGNPLGRNKRNVWTIAPQPFKGAHFATFPPKLVEPMLLAGSRTGDTVLDLFAGAGTVGLVAQRHGREFVGIELNPEYAAMAERRIADDRPGPSPEIPGQLRLDDAA